MSYQGREALALSHLNAPGHVPVAVAVAVTVVVVATVVVAVTVTVETGGLGTLVDVGYVSGVQ